ncbi:hypothetical protein BCR33DRAFT_779096 [Rhizoclosmatium globosum]|uniref:G-protein coupled receptors family 2 profile 2 domain-containing protein n=1 Tax=Rhizoclosmatium globosum TaxID=329046 RepID=A0A1Y2D385_9FUNG|nr:hypothetical protein BCR33DRAFT_779096 [Rhizoclosmatium globosum]|eukprot:ORY53758.1 hypothetical protein BCR33DRAFT_779096 [Rhizoclosmatium globosum]
MSTPQQLTLTIVGPITIAVTTAVIACVAFTKRFHKGLFYMQVFLAISEMICGIDWAIGVASDTTACMAIGIWHEFFLNATVCWTVLISVHCYFTVMKGAMIADSYWLYYHAYGWGCPLLLTAIGLVVQKATETPIYGSAGNYCWVQDKNMRVFIFYIELWLHLIVILVLYTLLFRRVVEIMNKVSNVSGSTGDSTNNSSKNETKRGQDSFKSPSTNIESTTGASKGALNVPSNKGVSSSIVKSSKQQPSTMSNSRVKAIVFRAVLIAGGFIVIWTPPTAGRLMQFFNITVPQWLSIYMTLSFSMMGIWNSFVFFLTSYWAEIMVFFGFKQKGAQADERV